MRMRRNLIAILFAVLLLCVSAVLAEEEQENVVYILKTDRAAGSVTVSYRVQSDAVLVLEVLADDGSSLTAYKTLRQSVSATDSAFEKFTFSLTLPEYFELEARLENLPAGQSAKPYVSIENLKEFRQYTDRTIHDWPGQTVLNLDSDETTNYAILKDGVRLIRAENGVTMTVADDGSGDFALTGSNEQLTALNIRNGETLVLVQEENGQVTWNGVHVTNVTAADGLLTVDAEPAADEECFSTSVFNEVYETIIEIDKDIKFDDPVSSSADAEIKLNGKLLIRVQFKGYLDIDDVKNSFICLYTEGVVQDQHIESRGNFQVEIPLAEYGIPGLSIPGIGGLVLMVKIPVNAVDTGIKCNIDFGMGLLLEFSPKYSGLFQGGMDVGQIGFSLDEASGELDLGIRCMLGLSAERGSVLELSVGSTHYACIAGKLSGDELSGGTDSNDYWHACVKQENNVTLPGCLSGTVGYMYTWNFNFKLFSIFSRSFQLELFDLFRYENPWYHSFTFDDGAFKKNCPHQGVRVDVQVLGSEGEPLSGAKVAYDAVSPHYEPKSTATTDANGKAVLYVEQVDTKKESQKNYLVAAGWQHEKYGMLTGTEEAIVKTAPVSVTIRIPTWETTMCFLDITGGAKAENLPENEVVGPNCDLYTIPKQVPTKYTYDFMGWALDYASRYTAAVQPGDTVTVDHSDYARSFYAVWDRTKYYITYDANGGTGAPYRQTKFMTEPVNLADKQPTRDGFVFLGWDTDPEADMPSCFPGQRYDRDENITLYAIWQQTPVIACKVSYDANANGEGSAPLPQFAALGTEIKLQTAEATWDDAHTFLGWSTEPDPEDGTPELFPGQDYTVTGDVTLYAVWQIRSVITYEVRYDPAPGTGGPKTQYQSEWRTLMLDSTVPEYEGHSFTGWLSSADGTSWQPGECYTARVSTLMTAEWAPDYHILEGDGSAWQRGSRDRLKLKANGPVTLFDTLLIDGEAVTAEDHYTVCSGSTVCELLPSYLNTLPLGEHSFVFAYADGQTEEGRFSVQNPPPETGDPGAPLLPALLALLGICLCVRKKGRA